jgi:SAM-dependent methyltransferase
MEYSIRDVLLDSQSSGINISDEDKNHYIELRKFVNNFINSKAIEYSTNLKEHKLLLDIAPQVHPGASPFTKYSNSLITIQTLDIDIKSNAMYICDITKNNSTIIKDNTFDFVLCTEVLEHTIQPFDAIKEIYRILKPGGILFLSVPCNFRIHGPLPDNLRFTQYGIQKALLPNDKWKIIEMHALDYIKRPLFPIDYTCVAKKI